MVPSVRSLDSYLSQIGQAGILVFEGIYLSVLVDQFFLSVPVVSFQG